MLMFNAENGLRRHVRSRGVAICVVTFFMTFSYAGVSAFLALYHANLT